MTYILFFTTIILIFLFVSTKSKLKSSLNELNEISKLNQSLQDEQNILTQKLSIYSPIINVNEELNKLNQEKQNLIDAIESNKTLLDDYESKVDLIESSYYQPKYEFQNYIEFVDALDLIREAERILISNKQVFIKLKDNYNKEIGKLALSSFNGDITNIVESVNVNNYEKSKEKIRVVFNKVNNLLVDSGISISEKYLDLKIKELSLVYDVLENERKIKEEQSQIKDQMREEEKARVEAEKAREKAIEDQRRYELALEQAKKDIEDKDGKEKEKFLLKIKELESKLSEATEERQRATSMAQITKKGHVYIISNIGSFGDNVFKIGMTRRKDPLDRIIELGDASVPFSFDIHAMVYTDDAPAFENLLHSELEEKRLNKVNPRKEFFRADISEIEELCNKHGYKINLTKLAEAREFKQSLELQKSK
ncbi:DUF4041 domain-containing protein [Leptospira kanakyensis]|uniref:DUF4041 domain-containing protein n=1 Tax=Leptospira kanakyensis TaxID=2484968 RepID=UPI00223CB990|nr:DUF4041 domain-containing protein [Leptospira kanakyensis]MCW7471796.1 DUF4041 domain-containing protein [Leptospira kanakyensis]MCW7483278.1 DUF4041 domain-containing protein [Leptospira kanakyensis]